MKRFSTPSWSAAAGSGSSLLLLSLLAGCASSGPAAPRAATDNANNVVVSSGGGGGGGQVIFKGHDNLLESSSRNSRRPAASNDQSVLIIEGSNNHLSYSEDGVVAPRAAADKGPARRDTAVVKANGLRRDVRVTGPNAGRKATRPAPAPAKAPAAPGLAENQVERRGETVDLDRDAAQAAASYDEREVLVPALNDFVPVSEALQHYAKLVQQGQVDALYQAALIYRDSAVPAEQQKAVDYLEAAARRNHGAAALALGALYEQGLRGWDGPVLQPSRPKAKYYYLLGLKNGGQLPDSKVQEINGW
jgi:hypothetical protein